MEAGTLALIIRDLISFAQTQGYIRDDGTVIGPKTPQQDAELAAGVETVLKNHGITVPDKVDAAIKMLPLILNFVS
jgi:hypothetical protein